MQQLSGSGFLERTASAVVFALAGLAFASPANGMVVTGLEALPTPLGGIYLRWVDGTTNETGFRVERKSGNSDYVELATTPPDNPLYTDTGLSPATAYTYRITALTGDSLPGSAIQVTTLPEWQVPVAEPSLQWASPGQLRLTFKGQGASYTVRQSSDMVGWSEIASSVYLPPEDTTFEWTEEVGTDPAFFEVLSRAYERPSTIGLSMPFELPYEPTGTIWDVTQFGASPSNIGPTNDDAVGIKVAISVAAAGDIVYIPAGTYTIRQVLQIPTGVTLRGAGMDETILITEGIDRAVNIAALAHDIRIEDFSIDYLGATEELLYGVYMGSSRSGNNSYRIVVDGLRIQRFSVHGVSLRDSHHVLVQNCEIANATNLGDGGHGYGIALNYPTNHNNWIRNNTIGPVIRHAILLQYYSHNNLVEHNLAYENTEDMYDLHGEDEYNNELRYNIARDGDRDGFGVGNTGATHDRAGPNNWIHHNTVEQCLYGIEVIQDSDVVYIDHNIFRDNSYGVRVHNLGGNHVYVRDNLIQRNQIGISVTTSRWIWLLDNHIEGQTQYGIEVLSGTFDLVDQGNTFSGNNLDYRP